MNFEIPCETYAKLAIVVQSHNRIDEFPDLRAIYIEHKNGRACAIASNVTHASIYFLGNVEGPDCRIAICVDDALIAQCEKEIAFSSKIKIVNLEAVGISTLKTTLGYIRNDAVVKLSIPSEFDKWREWLPDELPKKTNTNLYINIDTLIILAKSSPTGAITFSEHVASKKPMVLRDDNDPNWLGLFIPSAKGDHPAPATIPEWI